MFIYLSTLKNIVVTVLLAFMAVKVDNTHLTTYIFKTFAKMPKRSNMRLNRNYVRET